MYSKAFITLLLALFAVASPIEKRTAVQIVNDLTTLQTDTTTADNAIVAFSNTNGTLGDAFKIHNGVTTIDNDLKKTTADTKSTGPVSGNDATTILKAVKDLQPIIIKTLQDTVAKRPGFTRVGVTPVVKNDLQTLQNDTQALESALVSNAPSTLLPQATPIIASINAAFSSAVAAYAT